MTKEEASALAKYLRRINGPLEEVSHGFVRFVLSCDRPSVFMSSMCVRDWIIRPSDMNSIAVHLENMVDQGAFCDRI